MKMIFIIFFSTLLFQNIIEAKTYYLDPVKGHISNEGTLESPWPSLEEVIAANMIKSYAYNLPYTEASDLIEKNPSGVITGGDTLLLQEGMHGTLFLRNYHNLENILIRGDDDHQAIIKSIHLQSCSKWIFEGLEISSEPYGEYIQSRLVYFESHSWQGPSFEIAINNCHVYSSLSPWTEASEWLSKVSSGIYLKGDHMTVENNIIENIDMGITAIGNHHKVSGNDIINFSGDGMRILGSHNLLEYNLVKNCYNIDENHDDGIQSWTTNGIVVDSNIVRGNIILNYENPGQPLLGPLQGMGFFDGFFNGWVVENNLVIVNHWHGITFLGARDCHIVNNTVLDPSPQITPGASWIRVDDHKDGRKSSGCVVKNNVTNQLVVDGEIGSNVILSSINEYKNHFVDPEAFDFHLLASSGLIDRGASDIAPLDDLDGNLRSDGEGPDIGCYEFKSTVSTEDYYMHDNLKIYPVPVNEKLNISGNLNGKQLLMISSEGRILWQKEIQQTDYQIDLSSYNSGLYFLVLRDKNGLIYRQIIKS